MCFLNIAELCWHPLPRKGKQFGFRFSLTWDIGLTSLHFLAEADII
ncbi:hypothetical protein DEU53_11846 [Pantoea sp. AG1095]|nr:hypothetical protein DEU53_11846 [Pantoea sp. AG1095]